MNKDKKITIFHKRARYIRLIFNNFKDRLEKTRRKHRGQTAMFVKERDEEEIEKLRKFLK